MYGYAQCGEWSPTRPRCDPTDNRVHIALRTGRVDFLATCRKVSDVFLSFLPASGVPEW
jgi:hypothetical protein